MTLFRKSNWKRLLLFSAGIGSATTSILYLQDKNNYNQFIYTCYGSIRFSRTLLTGLSISTDYWWSELKSTPDTPQYNQELFKCHERSANKIFNACIANGGLYIKLGQGLATMNHVLPPAYIKKLRLLNDKCPRDVPFEEIQQIVKEDLNEELSEIFPLFDKNPIGAASLAQVYKAYTNTGNKVAVKIQYAELRDRFNGDVFTLRLLLHLIGIAHPDFSFSWVFEKLRSNIEKELDFCLEGKNAELASQDLKHLPYVYIPKILWKYTSPRILTMEYIDGIKVDETSDLLSAGFSLEDVSEKLVSMSGAQIFLKGFVHADPHPGNVLIRESKSQKFSFWQFWKTKKYKVAEIVLLDHGLYENLSNEIRVSLCGMFNSSVELDEPAMKMYAQKLGVKDYRQLAEILLMVPIKLDGHSFTKPVRLNPKLSEQDLKYMTEAAKDRFDRIMIALRTMPAQLLLILRNLNIVRSIVRKHGDHVDRFSILARLAFDGHVQDKATLFGKIRLILARWLLEFRLYFHRLYIAMIHWLMRMQPELRAITDTAYSQI